MYPLAKIKLIIFDLDGVLVDSKDMHFRTLNHGLVMSGYPPITYREHLAKYDGRPTAEKLTMLDKKKEYKGLWKHSGYIKDAKQEATIKWIDQTWEADTEILDVISYLHDQKYIIHVASNAKWETLYKFLTKMGILPFVSFFISAQDEQPKPSCAMYVRCMKEARIKDPSQVLVLEDHDLGRQAARKLKTRFLLVQDSTDLHYNNIFSRLIYRANLQLIIPAAGKGQRFVDAGYKKIKPMIHLQNAPMIDLVVRNMPTYANLITLVPEKLHWAVKRRELVVTDSKSAAETLYRARCFLNDDRPVLLANCDQYLEWDSYEFMAEAQDGDYDGYISVFDCTDKDPKYSYVELDPESKEVARVVEKVAVSTMATTGVYYWKSGPFLQKCLDAYLKDDSNKVNGEFYIAPLYNIAA